jgi:glycosyltransferase involved in cell wall biosynthesis
MNVFFIPSWYPSPDHPVTGIFFKEQAARLAACHQDVKVGISIWGQNEENRLLWTKDMAKNLSKLWIYFQDKRRFSYPLVENEDFPNLASFYTPALTWSLKVFWGNKSGIIQANRLNLQAFERHFGPVSLLHAHVGFPAGIIARQLSLEWEVPYLITEQMSPFPFHYYVSKGRLLPVLQQAYRDAHVNIAVSPAMMKTMQIYGVPKLRYIPNLVDENFFTSPAFDPLPPFTFFCLGRLVHQKGIPVLLEAFSQLLGSYPDTRLYIGGDGESRKAYEALGKSLRLTEQVSWLGELSREQVRYQMQHCHAFVLASFHETFGIVYAEALACGKPVIGTFNGGAEFIIHPDNGYLVEPGNAEQLCQAMERMILNQNKFDPPKIRQDCLERFSGQFITSQLKGLYEEVIVNLSPL